MPVHSIALRVRSSLDHAIPLLYVAIAFQCSSVPLAIMPLLLCSVQYATFAAQRNSKLGSAFAIPLSALPCSLVPLRSPSMPCLCLYCFWLVSAYNLAVLVKLFPKKTTMPGVSPLSYAGEYAIVEPLAERFEVILRQRHDGKGDRGTRRDFLGYSKRSLFALSSRSSERALAFPRLTIVFK